MKLEFHWKKSAKNKADPSRGFGLELAGDVEWETSVTIIDERYDYAEIRFITYGLIRKRLYVLIWTPRGEKRRVISLRKANNREMKFYEKNKA